MKAIISISILATLITFNLFANKVLKFNSDLDYAQIEFVSAVKNLDGTWNFSVTIRHNDEGWDHYTDIWLIKNPYIGKVLAKRVLAHPHVNEQPFTRSLSRVVLPKWQRFIEFSAKCSQHGFEGRRVIVDLTIEEGQYYSVKLQ